jgi:hypothetical protein
MAYPPLQSNGWLPSGIPWAEYITRKAGRPDGGMSDQAFSYGDGNQAVMSILVNFGDGATAIQDILGINALVPPSVTPASLTSSVGAVSLISGGYSYAVGNTLVFTGGTGTQATLTVLETNSSGAITQCELTNDGDYTVTPAIPVSATGGAGSGASFNPGYISSVSPQLSRILPVPHPVWPWLYASRITSMKPVKWTGKGYFIDITPGNSGPIPYSQYAYWLITIAFTQPKFAMLNDALLESVYGVPRQEWQRFVEYVPQPSSEVLSRLQGDFVWAEGTGTGGQPTAGSPVLTPTAQFLSKADQIYVWRRVPYKPGLVSAITGRPDNMLTALNGVNAYPFFNNPPGTLLFKSARITPVEDPVTPAAMGTNIFAGQPSLVCDVEICVGFFDPPHANSSYRGFILAPWSDGNWYKIQSARGTPQQPILPSVDFGQIFTLNY